MLNIGTDIVENKRIEASISNAFISKMLSKEEIRIYKEYKDNRAIQFICGRWAAKEAIIKCLSGYETPLMTDLVILNDESGKPYINYKNYDIKLSISHENNYAIAVAILNKVNR